MPPGGFDVYYCYTVRNTGLNTLNVHDLVDSELGTLFTGVNYSLAPGATYSHIQPATVYETVTNTGTWTAGDGVGNASAQRHGDGQRAPRVPGRLSRRTVVRHVLRQPFPPAGWTVTNTSTGCVAPGVPEWTNTNPGNRANLTGGVGPFAIADSDRCGSGSTLDTIMSTGMLDFTGLISPTVSFNTDYDDLSAGGITEATVSKPAPTAAPPGRNLFTWDSDHRGPLLIDAGSARRGRERRPWCAGTTPRYLRLVVAGGQRLPHRLRADLVSGHQPGQDRRHRPTDLRHD